MSHYCDHPAVAVPDQLGEDLETTLFAVNLSGRGAVAITLESADTLNTVLSFVHQSASHDIGKFGILVQCVLFANSLLVSLDSPVGRS